MAEQRRPLGSAYYLEEPIGRGAMGQVWRGSTRAGLEPVAIKVLRSEFTEDPEVVARFVQERSILVRLSHANLVRVRDLVVEGDTLAIVMDLVDGPDLRRYLARHGTLPPLRAVRIAVQVLAGLSAVHEAGIVHRDVKPENVLIGGGPTEGLTARITDFGTARITQGASSLTRMSSLIGTPDYMAPELGNGGRPSDAADIYSVGILLYELLCGRTPHAGAHPVVVLRRHMEDEPVRPPGLPDGLWAALSTLLAKNPLDRPASAMDAARLLHATSPGLAGVAPLARLAHHAEDAGESFPRGEASGSSLGGMRGPANPTRIRNGPGGQPPVPAPATRTTDVSRRIGALELVGSPRSRSMAALAVVAVVALVAALLLSRNTGSAGIRKLEAAAPSAAADVTTTTGPTTTSTPEQSTTISVAPSVPTTAASSGITPRTTAVGSALGVGSSGSPAVRAPPGASVRTDLHGTIAFVREARNGGGPPSIYVMNADGTGPTLFAETYAASGLRWSPDGKHLLFSDNYNLQILDVGGVGEPRKITSDTESNGSPSWSPDGSKIAFVGSKAGKVGVQVMNADGSGQTRFLADGYNPAWSPDGARIVFLKNGLDGPSDLWVMNADGTNARKFLSMDGEESDPSWAPDGRKLVFRHNDDVMVVNQDGTGAQRVATWPGTIPAANNGDPSEPSWSPDGKKIILTVYKRDSVCRIVTMNVDGTGQTELTSGNFCDRSAAWHPIP